jgi:type II secretory pathway pseudopilin PulG
MKKNAFSLIELLVIITIIIMLVAGAYKVFADRN